MQKLILLTDEIFKNIKLVIGMNFKRMKLS